MFNTHAFGRKLARLRKNADMTQSDLAERLNVTRQAISKYETGDSFPDVTILVTIAEVFGISVDELICAGAPTVGEAAILHSLAQGKDFTDGATPEDVVNLAVWLKPSAVEQLTVNLARQGINVSRLMDIAVYLSDEGTQRLLAEIDCAGITPEMLEHLLPFMDYDSRCRILDKILNGEMDWHLIKPLRVDRSLVEAAVIEGMLPYEALELK
jgi:transcriptional regulator with XRE-family HTH domain